MTGSADIPVDTGRIKQLLDEKRGRMRTCLETCAGCSLCAESCLLFNEKGGDPQYMPSYKVIKTLGRLYRKGGRVSRAELEQMQKLLWRNCVLCGRCYCPFGIDIPNMIAFARSILRSQGIYGVFPHTSGSPEAEYRDSGDGDAGRGRSAGGDAESAPQTLSTGA
jgi:Fe-S oxidoreductase